jgi:hypothetical protein
MWQNEFSGIMYCCKQIQKGRDNLTYRDIVGEQTNNGVFVQWYGAYVRLFCQFVGDMIYLVGFLEI